MTKVIQLHSFCRLLRRWSQAASQLNHDYSELHLADLQLPAFAMQSQHDDCQLILFLNCAAQCLLCQDQGCRDSSGLTCLGCFLKLVCSRAKLTVPEPRSHNRLLESGQNDYPQNTACRNAQHMAELAASVDEIRICKNKRARVPHRPIRPGSQLGHYPDGLRIDLPLLQGC